MHLLLKKENQQAPAGANAKNQPLNGEETSHHVPNPGGGENLQHQEMTIKVQRGK